VGGGKRKKQDQKIAPLIRPRSTFSVSRMKIRRWVAPLPTPITTATTFAVIGELLQLSEKSLQQILVKNGHLCHF